MPVEWNKKFELNISVIDAQHKQIVACLNELEQAIKKGVKADDIEVALVRIQQYTSRHFGMEEKYMKESHYPGLEKQLEAHTYFTNRLAELMAEYKTNGLTTSVVNSLKNELNDWIKSHVIGLDLTFGAYYNSYLAALPKEG